MLLAAEPVRPTSIANDPSLSRSLSPENLNAIRAEWKRVVKRTFPPMEQLKWLEGCNVAAAFQPSDLETIRGNIVAKLARVKTRGTRKPEPAAEPRVRVGTARYSPYDWAPGERERCAGHPCHCDRHGGDTFAGFPWYYMGSGGSDDPKKKWIISYECWLERQGIPEEGLPAIPSSPGTVVDMRNRKAGREKASY